MISTCAQVNTGNFRMSLGIIVGLDPEQGAGQRCIGTNIGESNSVEGVAAPQPVSSPTIQAAGRDISLNQIVKTLAKINRVTINQKATSQHKILTP